MWKKKRRRLRMSRILLCPECGSKRIRWRKNGVKVENFYCFDCEKYLSQEVMLAQFGRVV